MNEDIWIKRLEITNFQSHEFTTIDFVNGLNAIVGESNQGKTSIIRAIRWCFLNSPDGTDFIRNGANEAIVKVFLSNGKTIIRKRDRKKGNFYELIDENGKLDPFSGFGKKIPEKIVKAHGITPVGDGIYFQIAEQTEGPFMMSLKPKQRAEVLGNLEELSRVDRALSEVNSDHTASNKAKNSVEKELKKLKLELEKKKVEIERLQVKIGTLKELKEGIESILEVNEYMTKQLKRLCDIQEELIQLKKDIEKADRLITEWPAEADDQVRQFRFLSPIINRLEQLQAELSVLHTIPEDKIRAWDGKRKEIDEKVENFRELSRLLQQLETKESELEGIDTSYIGRLTELDSVTPDMELTTFRILFNHLEGIKRYEEDIEVNKKITKETEAQLKQLILELAAKFHDAGICATCGQKTDSISHEHVEALFI
jgi:exonuclease SbcC